MIWAKAIVAALIAATLFFAYQRFTESLREEGRSQVRKEYSDKLAAAVVKAQEDANEVNQLNVKVAEKLIVESRTVSERLRSQFARVSAPSDCAVQNGTEPNSGSSKGQGGGDAGGDRGPDTKDRIAADGIAKLHAELTACSAAISEVTKRMP